MLVNRLLSENVINALRKREESYESLFSANNFESDDSER